ncbi:pyridoxal phosphate-dependent aminotransferase [Adhaeribacter rhizoryzae]|uniref:Aminotransferase n=1 Tax=Adhaeribacter rhizoryzae TaxID=2607907 RepID=A0A5M6DMS8_9BACT|nr:aminotransferase class I/II-fold pyridoxal phosphate-dependent enzyme [Adhaeribacter rhizoryzae]KAA5547450.1 aminotransferase class I/II-fold pyridoxal phosphate-dependent enzyme [Adhaeribacter rhizoryzae]
MIIPKANRLEHVQEYYFARKLAEVRNLMAQGHDIINLGIGDPDMPASDETVAALTESAQNKKNHGYQAYRSIPALRTAMAKWYQQVYSVSLNPETEILPLLGSKEGIFHIAMAFLNPGDQVLVPNPGYPAYAAVTKLVNAEPVFFDLTEENNWLPDLDALRKLDTSKVKLMWLNYPNMPTGALASETDFEKIIQFAQERQILIVHDNPYSLVLNEKAPISILHAKGALDCCLELNSLSKSFNMAGWRVGMVAGKQEYIDAIIAIKSNLDSGMFLPIQHAAIQALANPESWHEERNNVYRQRRELIYELLDVLNCKYSKEATGMFVWGRVPDAVEDVEAYLNQILYEAHVFLTPGKIFGSNGERYVRVSVCATEENIQKAINNIKKLLINA